jgi:Domain of unknown function (DUF4349)
MRRADEFPPDDEMLATLEVIDATLAGEPVDPEHAELAELALILADDRPRPVAQFASRLDQRVQERFERPARSRPWRRLTFAPAALVVLASTIAAVFVLSSGGSGTPVRRTLTAAPSSATPSSAAAPRSAASSSAASSSAASSSAGAQKPLAAAASPLPAPAPNGHRIVQSAQLSLSTTPGRIEQVAQQIFDVVGAARGDVSHSTVTAAGGNGGFADFQLSVPSATLPQTMAQLSRLRGANVVSRTDATQDIGGSFVSANRRLADARALRTTLLRQLSSAVTTQQVDSLRARIRDAEASIASDLATLRTLRRQVGFSQISITISSSPGSHPVAAGGFTLGEAAHDAGRVLTVVAGVALIALAVLLPISVVAALVAFMWLVFRRRRREQALDLA